MLFLLLVGILLHGGDAQYICQWTSPLNDVDRSLFVKIHNTYRAYVARGEAYQLNGKLPGSTGLFELKYDCQLELMAHMNTYNCNQTFHPPTTSMNYFTMANEPLNWNKDVLIPMAVSSWYQPVLNLGIDDRDDGSNGTITKVITSDSRLESFANMMYYKSLKFGCSHNICPSTATTPSMIAIACVYSSAAQRFDQVYMPSRYGCVKDEDCWDSGVPFRCIKNGPYRGLCSQDTNVIVETTTVPAPKTSPGPWRRTTEVETTSSPSVRWDTTPYWTSTRRPWWDSTTSTYGTSPRWPWWDPTTSTYGSSPRWPWWDPTTSTYRSSPRWPWWDSTTSTYGTSPRWPWWDPTTSTYGSSPRWPWWDSTTPYYWDRNAINPRKLSPPGQLLDNDVKKELHNSQ